MCGICGFTGAGEADQSILKAMCNVMIHRGPDGEGRFVRDGIALGHRRLSLIDLEGGGQPFLREGGRYALVFNGEIYNYRDLREELSSQGWEFSTHSDTEVLLVSYLAWGKAALNRIRGMFSFALWDGDERELFCARDFFGIKPFYYTQQDGRFIFASEIKSILEHPAYTRAVNHEALEQYLCFQFSALPETFFKGIFKLPAAHCLTVHADGTFDVERYWNPEFSDGSVRSFDHTVETIEKAVQESVRYHNVADVEVGSFLSSGIDSSFLAACLAKENPSIKTFTVGFAGYRSERDEISWAEELARNLNVENASHHITKEEYWESLPSVVWHMDEPSGDPSAVALYHADKLAATQVKAVLSGEGADELFGGYRIYQTPFANARVSRVPKPLLRAAVAVAEAFHVRGSRYLRRASGAVEGWYYTNANDVALSPEERADLLKHPVSCRSPQQLVAPAYARTSAAGNDDITRMQYVDLHFWLVEDILLKTDKMAMAHSLESRVPFLDRGVFEVARTIPTPYKVNGRQTKIALRKAAEQSIPSEWAQKEKLGFPVPIVNWLREDWCYSKVKEWFAGSEAKEFFDTSRLTALLDEHRAGADRSRKIWICLMFLMWYRTFFTGS
jgi:asparagine synthase (glutamine-hydrolysing)